MNVRYVLINRIYYRKYTDYEFNLGAKICISSASSIFESGMDRVARLTLEMLISNVDELT